MLFVYSIALFKLYFALNLVYSSQRRHFNTQIVNANAKFLAKTSVNKTTMNTRNAQIRLRIDALSNWENASSKPLKLGEVGIAYQSINTAPEG
jgi:hypothetical protein